MVHGSGCTRDSFRAQSEAFPGSDAVALPGHPIGEALASVSAYSAWLSAHLKATLGTPAVVAGNSLGGAIAMRWALDHPDQAAGLVLIGTGARLRVSPDIFAMIERDWPACIATLVDHALGPAAPAELRERASQWHELVGAANTLRDYRACDAFDIMAEMSKLTLPTLVIVGDDDRLTPAKYARYLHEHIAGSRLEVIPDAGHLVMAERPAAVNALIADFLAKL